MGFTIKTLRVMKRYRIFVKLEVFCRLVAFLVVYRQDYFVLCGQKRGQVQHALGRTQPVPIFVLQNRLLFLSLPGILQRRISLCST